MAELVTLPSGAVAPLGAPGLAELLSSGGSLPGLARCVFAHDEVDVDALSSDDLLYVAAWAVEAFLETPPASVLGELGVLYSIAPSVRLGIAGELLGVRLDVGCLEAWQKARESGNGQDPEARSDEVVRFTTGGPE